MTWNKNMDDAPRDGTRIQVFAGGYQFVAQYDDGWMIASDTYVRPTHWKHLEKPPEVEG